jgi:hypothetical protein
VSWQTYGNWAFFAAAVAAVLFALLYLAFAPWWKTATGRNIMSVMGALAISFAYFAWVISMGGVPASFYPVRAILFTCIALAIGWRVWMFFRVQILQRKRDKRDELEDAR